ncbi:MAG: hypothetical protein V4683_00095 [Bacteroidota bacterium]
MAKTEHYFTKFEEKEFYHVYNRTVDKSPLFANQGNYVYFLHRLDFYLSDFINVYTYCLLGNHFHLLIEIKEEISIRANILKFEFENPNKILSKKSNKFANDKLVHDIVSHQFKKFFQSYSMSFNKQQNRIGTLFQKPFKRAIVDDNNYFTNLIQYIHQNPQKHGIIDDFRNYEWSSYQRILLEKPTKLFKNQVISWFGNKQEYINFHNNFIALPDNLYLGD